MRRWLIVALVAVVVLAGAGAGAWWLLRPKARPEPVAAAYLAAWGRSDWAAMQAEVATLRTMHKTLDALQERC